MLNRAEQALRRALVALQKNGPFDSTCGICRNAVKHHRAIRGQREDALSLSHLFKIVGHWPKCALISDDGAEPVPLGSYPIPSPDPSRSSWEYYSDAVDQGLDIWDETTQYGRDRRELLQFCINYLTTKANQQDKPR